jgi:hypothetical protein
MPNIPQNLPGGDEKLTEHQIKLSEWYLSHKVLLRKIFIGAMIAVSGGLFIFSLYFLIDWAFISGPKERANLKTILQIKVNPEALSAARAEKIVFGEIQTFAGGVGQYDIISQVKNPNTEWWVEFEYRFTGEGLDGKWKKGFLLPGDDKHIADLGLQLPFHPRSVYLETRSIKYHRIDNHKIPNYDAWRKERFDIILSDKNYNPNFVSDSKNIGVLTFKARNNTAYNFWSMGFYALLYRGDQLASVNYSTATNFLSGETRDLQISFYEGLPTITKFEIIPEVNIFDPEAYIAQN